MNARSFATFAERAACWCGSSGMFVGSLGACALWLVAGPILAWGEMWHLIPTSILTWTTWILVVLIQHAQNRHEAVLQRKLDELIKAIDAADNRLIGLEKRPPGSEPPPALDEAPG